MTAMNTPAITQRCRTATSDGHRRASDMITSSPPSMRDEFETERDMIPEELAMADDDPRMSR
jgi:hypothetical protein